MKRALILGSNGTIGQAMAAELSGQYELLTLSRRDTDYSEPSLAELAAHYGQDGPLDLIVSCIGVLQNQQVSPEKRLAKLDQDVLAEYFRINSILPALCIKHFAPLLAKPNRLDKQSTSVFAVLSAMVGSITDNKLGGWYGYRSSKAALNMLVKTAAIELARSHRQSALVSIHPGTTQSPLSQPFSSRVASDKYYTPEQTAERIHSVVKGLSAADSGKFFNWDGNLINW